MDETARKNTISTYVYEGITSDIERANNNVLWSSGCKPTEYGVKELDIDGHRILDIYLPTLRIQIGNKPGGEMLSSGKFLNKLSMIINKYDKEF